MAIDESTGKQLGGATGKGFMPGVSGNPAGRPKGTLSIKELIRKRLKERPDEAAQFVEEMLKNEKTLTWQMLEGKPSQQMDLAVDKDGILELTEFLRGISKLNDTTGSTGA